MTIRMSILETQGNAEFQQSQYVEELVNAQIQKELKPFVDHLERLRGELGSSFDKFLSFVKRETFQHNNEMRFMATSSNQSMLQKSDSTRRPRVLRPKNIKKKITGTNEENEDENSDNRAATEKLLAIGVQECSEWSPPTDRSKSSVNSLAQGKNNAKAVKKLLHAKGLAEFAPAFVNQDVNDIEVAKSLSLEEVRTVLNTHTKLPTVGVVRNCYRAFNTQQEKTQELQKAILPTPSSVLSRSLLHLGPNELKSALNSRINAETIFASLMLTIAATALMDTPFAMSCEAEYGTRACDAVRCAYLTVWGIASAGFVMACLVSLGSMQIIFGGACSKDIYARYIGGETYLQLAHNFISVGLVNGLLPGLCLNMFLRFPRFPWTCGILSLLTWCLWLFQLVRGIRCIWNIYGDFPGFGTMLQFFQGYITFAKTIRFVPDLEIKMRDLVRVSVASNYRETDLDTDKFEAQIMSKAMW